MQFIVTVLFCFVLYNIAREFVEKNFILNLLIAILAFILGIPLVFHPPIVRIRPYNYLIIVGFSLCLSYTVAVIFISSLTNTDYDQETTIKIWIFVLEMHVIPLVGLCTFSYFKNVPFDSNGKSSFRLSPF